MGGKKGIGQKKYTDKEKSEIVAKICELYVEGNTIESCCDVHNISVRTFSFWTLKIAELSKLYKEAKEQLNYQYKERLKRKADTALEKLVEGFEYEETEVTGATITDENGKKIFVPKNVKKITKRVHPNVAAVIFAHTNTNDTTDPIFVNMRNSNKVDITSNGKTLSGVVILPQSEIDNLENENPIDSLLENAEE